MTGVAGQWARKGRSDCPLLLPDTSAAHPVVSAKIKRNAASTVSVGLDGPGRADLTLRIVPPGSPTIARALTDPDPVTYADGSRVFNPDGSSGWTRILLLPDAPCGYLYAARSVAARGELANLRRIG